MGETSPATNAGVEPTIEKSNTEKPPKIESITTPDSEEKILYEPPPSAEPSDPAPPKEVVSQSQSDNLPEAVSNSTDLPEAAPKPSDRLATETTNAEKRMTIYEADKIAHTPEGTPLPGYSSTVPMTVEPQKPESAAAATTVTPLRLLGDQSDLVDCPFCRHHAETRVEKHASKKTHFLGTVLFITTLVGVCVPYLCKIHYNVDHHCGNCGRIVAHREHDRAEVDVFGTPEHLREVSRYPAAPPKPAEEQGGKKDFQTGK